MAHFAELDSQNVVLRVVVVDNEQLLDGGSESEARGVLFCQTLFGANTRWAQTSYNAQFRKNYAGVGFVYDLQRDAFVPPEPSGDGWVLDEETCTWKSAKLEAAKAAATMGVTRV